MSESGWRVRETDRGVDLPLHVQPRARRNETAGLYNGALKLKISAPPVDDAANRSVVEYFASLLDLPRSRLSIVSGMKSRDKVLRIEGISLHDLRQRIMALPGFQGASGKPVIK